jgi:hypothetical protein
MAMTVSITESSATAGGTAPKPAARAAFPVQRGGDGPPEVPESDLSFWDLLDVVNPLQHIPIVGSVYRAVTGDEIAAPARIAGGMLYGGVVGLVASVTSLAVERESGRDPGGHLLAMLGMEPGEAEGEAGTAVAALPQDAAGAASAEGATVPAPAPVSVAQAAPATAAGGTQAVPSPGARMFALPPRGDQESGRVFPLASRAVAMAPPTAEPASSASGAGVGSDPAPSSAAEVPAAADGTGAAGEPAWPPEGPTPLPRELVADAMMNALEKYQRTARLGGRGQDKAASAAVLPGAS